MCRRYTDALKRAYTLLEENGMTIYRSRMDVGSYSEDIVKVVSGHSKMFYIRANRCMSLTERIRQIEDWKSVEINCIDCQVASKFYYPTRKTFLRKPNFLLADLRVRKNSNYFFAGLIKNTYL